MMRLLIAAAVLCLMPAAARAELFRVEFEAELVSADEGFPISLAEGELLHGSYLVDTGTYFLGLGSVLGRIEFQAVPRLVLVGQSGWSILGRGQANSIGDRWLPSISMVNRPLFSIHPYSITVDSVPVLVEPSPSPQDSLPRVFTGDTVISTDFEDLHNFNVGFDTIEVAGDFYDFDYENFPPSAPITLLLETPEVSDLSEPLPYVDGVHGELRLLLQDTSGALRRATFEITRLAVVPEPATTGLLCLCGVAMLGYRSRRSA